MCATCRSIRRELVQPLCEMKHDLVSCSSVRSKGRTSKPVLRIAEWCCSEYCIPRAAGEYFVPTQRCRSRGLVSRLRSRGSRRPWRCSTQHKAPVCQGQARLQTITRGYVSHHRIIESTTSQLITGTAYFSKTVGTEVARQDPKSIFHKRPQRLICRNAGELLIRVICTPLTSELMWAHPDACHRYWQTNTSAQNAIPVQASAWQARLCLLTAKAPCGNRY